MNTTEGPLDIMGIDRARKDLQRALAALEEFESRDTLEAQSATLLDAADAALDAVRCVSFLRHELIQARARRAVHTATHHNN
jgi:hypothetical protein